VASICQSLTNNLAAESDSLEVAEPVHQGGEKQVNLGVEKPVNLEAAELPNLGVAEELILDVPLLNPNLKPLRHKMSMKCFKIVTISF
jgi:hypothetical protein